MVLFEWGPLLDHFTVVVVIIVIGQPQAKQVRLLRGGSCGRGGGKLQQATTPSTWPCGQQMLEQHGGLPSAHLREEQSPALLHKPLTLR